MTSTHPFVSVIVLNYNGLQHLQTVLTSLEKQTYPADKYEIVLADNGSSDESITYTQQHHPRVRTMVFEKNFGFAEGNNIAARKVSSEVLAFLNNDTEADPAWLEALVSAYEHDQNGIYGSQAYQFNKRHIGANSVAKLMAWGIPTNVNVYKSRETISSEIEETLYADAAGMLIGRNVFLALGGFNPSYFAYEEEKDLGWKGWLLGHKSYVVPASIYFHKGGATLGKFSNRAIFLLWRNGLRNLIKYPTTMLLWPMLILHVGYSLSSLLLIFLPQKRVTLAWSIFKAYASIITELPTLLRQRKEIQRGRVVSDRDLQKRGLLLGPLGSLHLAFSFLQRRRSL